jgi:hypothetical protein
MVLGCMAITCVSHQSLGVPCTVYWVSDATHFLIGLYELDWSIREQEDGAWECAGTAVMAGVMGCVQVYAPAMLNCLVLTLLCITTECCVWYLACCVGLLYGSYGNGQSYRAAIVWCTTMLYSRRVYAGMDVRAGGVTPFCAVLAVP